jgi:hypothetical protein
MPSTIKARVIPSKKRLLAPFGLLGPLIHSRYGEERQTLVLTAKMAAREEFYEVFSA